MVTDDAFRDIILDAFDRGEVSVDRVKLVMSQYNLKISLPAV